MKNGTTAIFLLMASNCVASRLSPQADRAFENYVANLEARLARQHERPETYLAVVAGVSSREGVTREPLAGDMRVEPVNGGTWQAGGALLHHWRGTTYVPNATPRDMLTLLQDFNHFSRYYAPEIASSRTLSDGSGVASLAIRFKQRKVLTIVLDAEYRVEARLSGHERGYSISRSIHIWQVDHPGTQEERRRPPGEDDGFLWRLNSYWSFARVAEGLQIECEAVSLTRDVPSGLGWLISPIIADFPREELAFTLRATKQALTAGVFREEDR